MRIDSGTIKDIQLFKYYRLVRKWACKTYDLTDADLELLIYLDCKKRFTRNDFINGTYTYSWDRKRWEKLRKAGFIDVWRQRNRTSIKYTIYKTSFKTQHLIMRIYKKNVHLCVFLRKLIKHAPLLPPLRGPGGPEAATRHGGALRGLRSVARGNRC